MYVTDTKTRVISHTGFRLSFRVRLVKLAVMAAVSEVDDEPDEQPDDEANLGRERQARNQIEAGENA